MKTSTILAILLSVLILAGCTSNNKSDIAGIYVNTSNSEYSLAYDTLIIEPINGTENMYQVQDKTGYQRIKNKVLQPMHFEQHKWQATWEADKLLLSEGQLGRQIQYVPGTKSLLIKNTAYLKIK